MSGLRARVGGDGIYVRTAVSDGGEIRGPMTVEEFDAFRVSNRSLLEAASVWREVCGQAFKIDIREHFEKKKLLSSSAFQQAFEFFMLLSIFFCTAYAFRIVDWSKEKNRGAKAFVFVLVAACLVMGVHTLRVVCRRWKSASTSVKAFEVV